MAELLSVLFEKFLSKSISAAENELRLLLGVEKEKQKLGSNMSRITAVLQDAESRQVLDKAAKDWLRKLKDAVYDIEDLLDELVVEDRRRKVENEDGIGTKARNFFSPLNPLCFRYKIAHKIQELRERLDALAKENKDFPSLGEFLWNQSPLISDNDRETSSKVIPSEVCGRHDEKEELVNLLTNSDNEKDLSVIAIVAMGGLGKTTLAQLVYNDEKVMAQFQLMVWVYVSDRDFHVKGLLGKILGCENNDTPDQLEQLQNRVREKLSGKRYLLVLDDVWNEDPSKWGLLRTGLKCGAIGSKILVTTRSKTVARIMDALPIPLPILTAVESWKLFDQVAKPPTCFESIGKDIVKKCDGVPLAIKTLGGMLLNEPSETEWQSVRDSELWKTQDHDGGILPALRLSYAHLTPSLKQCFAYCAVIRKGWQFNKDELIKQWIAQGFIHSDDENELLEEEGEKCFNALLRRSLFQVDADNGSYKMHDLIHDLLRSIAGKECFVAEASMMNDLTRHLALFNDETRHLALWNDDTAGEMKNLDALKKCKKLRSMIIHGYRGSIDINVLLSFRCLRVLDLSWKSIHFLPNSIDKLRHLRYFDISFTEIKELPETICNLHNLQTLRVLGIPLKKWPKNMKRMISLRHIEFHEWRNDFPLPKGIGGLTFLRTLPNFIIAKESGARIEELKDLNLLWGNIHIGGLENIGSVECAGEADLKAKKHLSSLKLSWSGNETVAAEGNAKEVIEILEPHSDLKELSVENYTGLGFPSLMMKKLTNLKKISLSSCKRCEQLPPLGQLGFLESLEIDTMDAVKHIVEFDGSHNYNDFLPSLKDLHLWNMPNLERWSSPQEDGDGDEQGRERYNQVIFKCLRTLKIHDCPKLARPPRLLLPDDLEELELSGVGWERIVFSRSHSLKRVDLFDMPNLERWSLQEVDDDKDEQVTFHSLCTLGISKCPKLISLPQLLLPALEELKMEGVGCEKIEFSASKSVLEIGDSCEKQTSLPGDGIVLPSLKELRIDSCKNIESLSADMLKNLTKLSISDSPKVWSSLVSLENLKSLESLSISGCPETTMMKLLESMENLTSITSLSISDCPTDMRPLPKSVKICTSLTFLRIEGCPGMRSLPEWVGDLTLLRDLRILFCPAMMSLPEWLGDLTLLGNLKILHCPAMMSLPEGLQRLKNLESLFITGCPVLERRVQRNKGQDWHKVAHVGYIYTDTEGEESSDQSPHLLLHSLKKLEKFLPLPSCCSSSPSSSSPPST